MKKNYNIFKTLEYPLTVKAAKIVVPVYLWNLSTAGKIFVQLNALQHAGIAPIASVKGYRQFLKQNKNNEKVLNSWYYDKLMNKGIGYQAILNKSWEYINLQELYDFDGTTIDLESSFERYLHANVYDNGSFKQFVELYLKYLPYITLNVPTISTSMYCCEDCDGDYNSYVKNNLQHECTMLKFKVRDMINVDYKYSDKFGW